ncbi:MAG: hypothetical protein WCD18_03755 [Thermosynechococcaceae cyanobacterium]
MTLSTESRYKPIDEHLLRRYCEIFEIRDWKALPKDRLGAIVFVEMPAFWKERSEWLCTKDPEELLKNTPVLSAHTFPGTPAYQRLQER